MIGRRDDDAMFRYLDDYDQEIKILRKAKAFWMLLFIISLIGNLIQMS